MTHGLAYLPTQHLTDSVNLALGRTGCWINPGPESWTLNPFVLSVLPGEPPVPLNITLKSKVRYQSDA